MRTWLGGKMGGLAGFVVIAILVVGGLGWVTREVLELEYAQRQSQVQADLRDSLRLAMWKLDSRISPVIAREDARPYDHFSAIYAPSLALQESGRVWQAGKVLELSPLLNADLPDWLALHYQTDQRTGWSSPQVWTPVLCRALARTGIDPPADEAAQRRHLLDDLKTHLTAKELEASVLRQDTDSRLENTTLVVPGSQENNNDPIQQANSPRNAEQQQTRNASPDYLDRLEQKSRLQKEAPAKAQALDSTVINNNTIGNGEKWLALGMKASARGEKVPVALGTMNPLWLRTSEGQERLLLARLVRIGDESVCQGVLLDWPRLQKVLAQEVIAIFPQATFHPEHDPEPEYPERTMTALPVRMDIEPVEAQAGFPGWTPLRIGLLLAWTAAIVALSAVGLGGWTLIELSERRIRFVSAVTHELRTPLTTLRLYLDMLTGGMVKDEQQKDEYLLTLNEETDRLTRLVGNVLDFSRLENHRPQLEISTLTVTELLEQVRLTWQGRCERCAKELLLESNVGPERPIVTDVRLVQQVLGNLIDNACKYSRDAGDHRLWLRCRTEGRKWLFEVEDRGPGITAKERRTIFNAFRRGNDSDTTGGVGLGLALGRRWANLLGGQLDVCSGTEGVGACFRLILPIGS